MNQTSASSSPQMHLAHAVVGELIELKLSILPFAQDEADLKLKRYERIKEWVISSGFVEETPEGGFRGVAHQFTDLDYELQICLMEIAFHWNANPARLVQEIVAVPGLFEVTWNAMHDQQKRVGRRNLYAQINQDSQARQDSASWQFP